MLNFGLAFFGIHHLQMLRAKLKTYSKPILPTLRFILKKSGYTVRFALVFTIGRLP
jgi:hypothetical protein